MSQLQITTFVRIRSIPPGQELPAPLPPRDAHPVPEHQAASQRGSVTGDPAAPSLNHPSESARYVQRVSHHLKRRPAFPPAKAITFPTPIPVKDKGYSTHRHLHSVKLKKHKTTQRVPTPPPRPLVKPHPALAPVVRGRVQNAQLDVQSALKEEPLAGTVTSVCPRDRSPLPCPHSTDNASFQRPLAQQPQRKVCFTAY